MITVIQLKQQFKDSIAQSILTTYKSVKTIDNNQQSQLSLDIKNYLINGGMLAGGLNYNWYAKILKPTEQRLIGEGENQSNIDNELINAIKTIILNTKNYSKIAEDISRSLDFLNSSIARQAQGGISISQLNSQIESIENDIKNTWNNNKTIKDYMMAFIQSYKSFYQFQITKAENENLPNKVASNKILALTMIDYASYLSTWLEGVINPDDESQNATISFRDSVLIPTQEEIKYAEDNNIDFL
jgi:hypothetical protein